MKTTITNKKVRDLVLTQIGKVNRNFENAWINSRIEGNKIYHTYVNGSGRWSSNQSSRIYFIQILEAFGYKYSEGNDAPRGGATGDYIKVSSVAMRNIKNIFTS